jgi:hypothetical protein
MDGYGQSRAVDCDATVPHGESQAEAAPRHEGTRGAWTAQVARACMSAINGGGCLPPTEQDRLHLHLSS